MGSRRDQCILHTHTHREADESPSNSRLVSNLDSPQCVADKFLQSPGIGVLLDSAWLLVGADMVPEVANLGWFSMNQLMSLHTDAREHAQALVRLLSNLTLNRRKWWGFCNPCCMEVVDFHPFLTQNTQDSRVQYQ